MTESCSPFEFFTFQFLSFYWKAIDLPMGGIKIEFIGRLPTIINRQLKNIPADD